MIIQWTLVISVYVLIINITSSRCSCAFFAFILLVSLCFSGSRVGQRVIISFMSHTCPCPGGVSDKSSTSTEFAFSLSQFSTAALVCFCSLQTHTHPYMLTHTDYWLTLCICSFTLFYKSICFSTFANSSRLPFLSQPKSPVVTHVKTVSPTSKLKSTN